jgi:inosine-uridine nucleoside N-ribohydrolase
MRRHSFTLLLAVSVAVCAAVCPAQKRLVLVDQDGSGPGGSDQMSMLVLLQSPQVQVLGITMVAGDGWVDEETNHTLRMLELTGHQDTPVVKGAEHPLIRSQQETSVATELYGKVGWQGAWDHARTTAVPEGEPKIKAIDEDAAHFLVRQVRAHPHEVTIYAAGPLTNIALAISIDPEFASLTKGIVLMGGSLNPQTDDPEFATSPTHEFNLWFDPEAAHIVLRADWPRVDVTTADVSLKAPFTQAVLDAVAKSQSPAARYIAAWSKSGSYMWDELAACSLIDPSVITKEKQLYMDVDLSHGPSYGETLTWSEPLKPATATRIVHAQMDLDLEKFHKMFVELMSQPSH